MSENLKLEIVHLHPHFLAPGGATSYVLELSNALQKLNISSTVITIKVPAEIKAKYPNIHFIEMGGFTTSSLLHWMLFPLIWLKLLIVARKHADKVFIAHAFPSCWWGVFLKIFFTIKVIWVAHDPNYFLYNESFLQGILKKKYALISPILIPLRAIDQFLFQKIDAVVVHSKYLSTSLKSIYRKAAIKEKIIYPGVDHSLFKPDTASIKKYDFMYVGRLSAYKNVDTIIYALKDLLERSDVTDAQLAIVGDGEEKQTISTLIDKLKLSKHVSLLSNKTNKSEVAAALSQSRSFVSMSDVETFGLAPLEAMAVGVPCVLVNAGAFPELIDTSNGILVENNSKSLALAMKEVIAHNKSWQRKSKHAVAKAEQFNWNKTAERFVTLLLNLN